MINNDSPIDSLAEQLPNLVQLTETDAIPTARQVAAAVTDACQSLLVALQGDVSAVVSACVQTCRVSVGDCQNCVAGQFAGSMDGWNKILSKCQDNVSKQVNTLFDGVVSRVISAGAPMPTQDAIIAVRQGVDPAVAVAQSAAKASGPDLGFGTCPPGEHWVDGVDLCVADNPGQPLPSNPQPGPEPPTPTVPTPQPAPSQTAPTAVPGNHPELLQCGVGETTYFDPVTNATYCVSVNFKPGGGITLPPPPTTPPPTTGGGGTPQPGGGTTQPPTYNPPSAPGTPVKTCQGLIDPCANLPPGWVGQGTDYGVRFYVKVPVYDSCGNLVGCWQMPLGCKLNLPGVQYDAMGCPIVTQVICDNPEKCVPPWVCADGYSYDQKTGTCTQTTTQPPPQTPCPDGQQPADDGTCPPPKPPPPPPPPPNPTGNLGQNVCDPATLASTYQSVASKSRGGSPNTAVTGLSVNFGCDQLSSLNPLKLICSGVEDIVTQAVTAVSQLLPDTGCTNDTFIGAAIGGGLLGFVGQWTGIVPAAMKQNNQYQQNLGCQYLLPGYDQAIRLSVGNWITDEQWESLTAVNGHCVPWSKIEREASYRYPNLTETLNLYFRGEIDETKFADWMRRNGVKDDEYIDKFAKLSRWFPDTTRGAIWYQQGVDDEQYAQLFDLDNGFQDWLQSPLGRGVGASNQTESDAQRIYRSTWQRPSLNQVIEAYQRISQDQTLADTDVNVPHVGIDELQKALENSGIPPRWQSRIAYLMYSPISVRHLRLMYETGVIDEPELARRYQSLKYSPDDAAKLARAIAVSTDQQKAQLQGYFSKNEILRLYEQDGINRSDAQEYLHLSGVPDDSIDSLLFQAEAKRKSRDMAEYVKALKRRFLLGDYDSGQAQQQLASIGVEADRVSQVVKNWTDALTLKHKQPAVGVLCEWVQRNYISAGEYLRRMGNLGYTDDDAASFLNGCTTKAREKALKAAEVAARKAAADAKKRAAAEKAARPYRDPPKPYFPAKVSRRRATGKRINLDKNKTTITQTSVDESTTGVDATVQTTTTTKSQ